MSIIEADHICGLNAAAMKFNRFFIFILYYESCWWTGTEKSVSL